jgi:hypothetical protein
MIKQGKLLTTLKLSGYQPEYQCADISLPQNDTWNASSYTVTYEACSVTIFSNQSNSSSTIGSCPNGYKFEARDDISFVTEVRFKTHIQLYIDIY